MTESTEAATCPYCGAQWTVAMLHLYARYSRGTACGCCVVLPGLDPGPETVALPPQDLCCERCDKPIYSAPQSTGHR